MLLPKKLLVQEKETQLRKQKKPLLVRESVKLHQEKVLEEQLEEKPQGDLLEGEDARTSLFFYFILIQTVKRKNKEFTNLSFH